MEPSSAVRKKKMCWRNLWQLVLLAASILSSCFLLIEGQATLNLIQIQVQPEHPIEGHNVTLTLQGNMSTARSCLWYRGETFTLQNQILMYYFPPNPVQNPGPASTNRETAGLDCSLHIKNLSSRDTGNYRVSVDKIQILPVGYAFIVVSENLSSPRLESSLPKGTVAENSSVILNCRTSNQPDVSIFWSKDRNLLPATRGDLSDRNRTLTFPRVSRNDSGTYRCMAKNRITNPQSNPVEILVTYGPELKLNPEGIVFKRLKSDLLVKCLVDSVPEAKLQWFFNGNEQNETGSIFKVRLRDHNNRGSYTCRATNPFNNHTEERTCYVILRKGHVSAAAIVGIVAVCLAGVALTAVCLYFLYTKTSFRVKVQPPTSSGEVEETPQAN